MSLRNLIEAVEAGRDHSEKWHPALGEHGFTGMMAFHGSLDAAKRLHDALVPEYGYGIGGWGARVWLYSDRSHWDGSNRQEVEMADTPARAWLLAILRAMEAEKPE